MGADRMRATTEKRRSRPPASERPTTHPVLRLQETAGNAAVAQLFGATVAVQRHNSWEHALLGDTPPSQLGQAAVTNGARQHVVSEEWHRMNFFRSDPTRDPRPVFPDVRWIQLRGSSLWVSNGELNALGDYLPDASAADTMTAEQLTPVLQRMRGGILGSAGAEFGLRGNDAEGMATSNKAAALSFVSDAASDVSAIDSATEDLGTNRYSGLLSRNACHFAPMSWERWSLNHNTAVEEAGLHYTALGAVTELGNVDTSVEEHERQALLNNGYADHFLQDSFAAGHLVNKTEVMQWFLDYLSDMSWLGRPWKGAPSSDVRDRMGSEAQPGIAGTDRYHRPPSSTRTSAEDRAVGDNATDPQTGQERHSREGRVAGSGVSGEGAEQEQNYQAYLDFLNNSMVQLSAGAVHDYFNARGLVVRNQAGTEMTVGGDDTLLSKSDEIGAETAGRAAQMSRQAIDTALVTGAPNHSVDEIFALVPQTVVMKIGGAEFPVPLEQFQTAVIHDLCFQQLFPLLLMDVKTDIVRTFSSEMVDGGMSVDSGVAPGPALGDYDVSSSGSLAG